LYDPVPFGDLQMIRPHTRASGNPVPEPYGEPYGKPYGEPYGKPYVNAPCPARPALLAWAVLVVLLLPAAALADRIYRSVDAQGRPVFSDKPPTEDAQPLDMAPLMTFEAPPLEAAPHYSDPIAAASGPAYEALAIVSPRHDEAVRSNTGDVSITTRLTPVLRTDHRLQFLLDGQVVDGAPDGGTFNLTNVHRGTHVVQARVVDEGGRVLIESSPVTFHMLQISVLTRPR
jgi:hypothetical protein